MQELAGITVIYPSGDKTIYEILREKGIFLDAPCAGNGRCGKYHAGAEHKCSSLF